MPADKIPSEKTEHREGRRELHLSVGLWHPRASLLLAGELQMCSAVPLPLPMGYGPGRFAASLCPEAGAVLERTLWPFPTRLACFSEGLCLISSRAPGWFPQPLLTQGSPCPCVRWSESVPAGHPGRILAPALSRVTSRPGGGGGRPRMERSGPTGQSRVVGSCRWRKHPGAGRGRVATGTGTSGPAGVPASCHRGDLRTEGLGPGGGEAA